MPLATYRRKRDFGATPEPAGAEEGESAAAGGRSFVVQKHWASRLHYDFRLEHGGVLWSWAVPKGPSFDPADKPVAIHVEDHPLDYAGFEGTIPKGHYGAGRVIVWDRGTWEHAGEGDPAQAMAAGKLVFTLHGEKLAGLWELVRIAKPGEKQEPWILFKKRDAWARPKAEYDVLAALPDSVLAGTARSPMRPASKARSRPDRAAALPDRLAPQLATAVAAPPPGGGWIVETKFDGYRLLARIGGGGSGGDSFGADGSGDGGSGGARGARAAGAPGAADSVRLFTRNGHDWTGKMPALAAELSGLGLAGTWLDGEIVVLAASGVPDFNALQNAVDGGRSASDAIVYFAFDVPFLGGRDLRGEPLATRRAALVEAIEPLTSPRLRLSQAFDAPPLDVLEAARRMGLEGIVVKRRDAPYVSARTETWLKVKCASRQAFVVVCWTERANAPRDVGSMMLATRGPDGTLIYAGNVGTGWNAAQGGALRKRLLPLATEVPTVDPKAAAPGRWSKRAAGGERWVEPRLVVDVSFADWTPDGHVRHAVWRGFRDDKAADEVVRERPGMAAAAGAAGAPAPSTVRITNPERVIDAATGLTKLDLFRHYESVALRILPHLEGRPVSLVRAPDGVAGTLFFQKHLESKMPGVTPLDPALWPGHSGLLTVDSVDALLAAAQMNTIEFHTWNSTAAAIDQPDRIVFDLDPGEGVAWPRMQEAAWLVRTLLEELGLSAFLKTSGGKGLHVVAPLLPEAHHDAVKALAKAAVQHLARTVPDRFVAKSGAGNRVGRIFVDWLRMSRGATTAAAFSARARPGLGVSVPIAWEQLASVKSGAEWSIATAREHLSFERVDPWEGYEAARCTIDTAASRLASVR